MYLVDDEVHRCADAREDGSVVIASAVRSGRDYITHRHALWSDHLIMTGSSEVPTWWAAGAMWFPRCSGAEIREEWKLG